MALERIKRRFRFVGMTLGFLVTIYRRDRHPLRLLRTIWFVTTRHGLVGIRQWLITTAWQDEPVNEAAAEAEAAAQAGRPDPFADYQAWLDAFCPLQDRDIQQARDHLATLDLPELLVLVVVTAETLPHLDRMAASWRSAIHTGWRAAIVATAGLSAADHAVLDAFVAATGASRLASEEEILAARLRHAYTLLSVGSTLLNPLSTYMVLEAAVRTGAEFVYGDHDQVDDDGRRSAPVFKPQFSPEYLARYNYVGDCFLLSRTVPLGLDDAGCLLRFDVAAFDRMVARLAMHRPVEHLPFLLFHTMAPTPRSAHDIPVFADTGPSVAIVIPTRDGFEHLKACIDSIAGQTAYDMGRVDIVVMDNGSVDAATVAYLDELAGQPQRTVMRYPGAFNFAEINNQGARSTTCDVLVFLNDDTTVHDPAWLSKLVGYAAQPGVGMVGAKLLYPDGTIQHGGCVAGSSRGTVQHLLSSVDPADVAASDHTREMTTMTGACLAVRREVFQRIGGFDPILRITWNDVKACLESLAAGYRNIYVADPLLIHHESKTRGQDDTRERYHRYFSEADYTRRRFRAIFYDDPSYSPNLFLEESGPQLAQPPRVRHPWFRNTGRPARILMLSTAYRVGFGVSLVIHQHAMALRQLGYEVILGGPESENEFAFAGCERVHLEAPKQAACYAFTHGVALVISHTPPYFELPILIGGHIPVLSYDYGEPDAEFFPEPVRTYLREVKYQKREAAALTTTVAAISQAVKQESLNKDALVLGLANSHLPAWAESFRGDRDRVRQERGWSDAFVVLTVCRFHENERSYKGLDTIATILREVPYLYPEQSRSLVWLLAGRGTPEDVAEVEVLGFTVLANVSDEDLADIYRASDAYMGFSKWEGYNLGISQALAMGLPTLGSDIAAHREFPITTTNSVLAACGWLAGEVDRHTAATPDRRAVVYEWERSASAFVAVVEDMLQSSAVQAPRRGASGVVGCTGRNGT